MTCRERTISEVVKRQKVFLGFQKLKVNNLSPSKTEKRLISLNSGLSVSALDGNRCSAEGLCLILRLDAFNKLSESESLTDKGWSFKDHRPY